MAGALRPGRREHAGTNGHPTSPPVVSWPFTAWATWSCAHSMARLVGMPLTAFATMSGSV